MAAKDPDMAFFSRLTTVEAGESDAIVGLDGLNHVIVPFILTNIDDADTYSLEGSSGTTEVRIVRAAWEPVNATDLVAFTISGSTVTFATTGNNHTGYLHLWLTR